MLLMRRVIGIRIWSALPDDLGHEGPIRGRANNISSAHEPELGWEDH